MDEREEADDEHGAGAPWELLLHARELGSWARYCSRVNSICVNSRAARVSPGSLREAGNNKVASCLTIQGSDYNII